MTPFAIRRKIFFSFLFIFFVWAVGLLLFYAQIPQSKSEFSENSADAIVVLTGDEGRLEYGLELLATRKAKILFISGAGEKVTTSDIVSQAPQNFHNEINSKQIILGHKAENTIGNAEEIKSWLTKTSYKKIILITSDYHMPRSLYEIASALPNITIFPAPVLSHRSDLILSEYHKYIASNLRHIFVSATDNK